MRAILALAAAASTFEVAGGAVKCRGRSGSTLLVRVEDVVLRLHWRMARVSAV